MTEWLQPVPDQPGDFRSIGVGHSTDGAEQEMTFVPFIGCIAARTRSIGISTRPFDLDRNQLQAAAVVRSHHGLRT